MKGSKTVFYRQSEFTYDEESRSYSGYGIVFDSDSLPLNIGGKKVYERIKREFLEEADMSDVLATFNHNFDQIFGRSSSGTLTLEIDDTGVKYRFELPDTSYASDLAVMTQRKDIKGSSFGFLIDFRDYEFEERGDSEVVAYPTKIERILDIGPVVNPAYPSTTAENRSAFAVAAENYIEKRAMENESEEEEINNDHVFARLRVLKHAAC